MRSEDQVSAPTAELRCPCPFRIAGEDETATQSSGDGKLRFVLALLGAAVLSGLVGCPGMGPKANAKFQASVAKKVTVGMPFVTAIEHLVKAGFSCDDRVRAPAVSCERDRMSLLPYTCIQRVILQTDAERRTIVEVNPRPIGCAGL